MENERDLYRITATEGNRMRKSADMQGKRVIYYDIFEEPNTIQIAQNSRP
jgi:hypothetical protein